MKPEKAIVILRMGEQARWRSGVTVEEEKEAVDMAIEALKEKRPQWIPCSEQLPSDAIHADDMVLVCYENGSIRFNSFMDGQWVQGNPIAWMPLPDPYKKEGEAE